ncbi:DUF4181 domain-containing protein [Bacillus suaedae]|uniref:DUF4181 domain-containing protein n=1 Tax=Halalkalibacter suaedae TaxID=2822140 RepID=A0A940WZM2_9BACI|nr:DUF4181 domain-containing protein [Bacillus suaedae]MBP3951666.1 DUF4181 domain-containing protein [Bacillus suaedae]
MLAYMILYLSVCAVQFLLKKFVRKKYNIEPDPEGYRTYVNNEHKKGLYILGSLTIVFLVLAYIIQHPVLLGAFVISAIALGGFGAFMEFRYERERKGFIISIIETVSISILVIGGVLLIMNDLL